jgi:hypothetical protein
MNAAPKSPQFNLRALFAVTASAAVYLSIWRFIDSDGGYLLAIPATGVLVILLMIISFSPRQ